MIKVTQKHYATTDFLKILLRVKSIRTDFLVSPEGKQKTAKSFKNEEDMFLLRQCSFLTLGGVFFNITDFTIFKIS